MLSENITLVWLNTPSVNGITGIPMAKVNAKCDSKAKKNSLLIYFLFLDKAYGLLQFCTLLTLPLLYRYKGSVGKLKMNKWFFYIYFPAHMAIVGILRLVIWGDIPLVF